MTPRKYITSEAASLNDFIHWRWNSMSQGLIPKWFIRLQYKTEAPIFFLFCFLTTIILKLTIPKKGSRYEGRSLRFSSSLSLSLCVILSLQLVTSSWVQFHFVKVLRVILFSPLWKTNPLPTRGKVIGILILNFQYFQWFISYKRIIYIINYLKELLNIVSAFSNIKWPIILGGKPLLELNAAWVFTVLTYNSST